MKHKDTYLVGIFLIFICLSGIVEGIDSDSGIMAITVPSADITMSFVKPGIIEKVLIKEGDEVSKTQMLVQQDTEIVEISLAQKKIDLKRLEWAGKRGSATDLEVEHAGLEVRMLEITIDDMTLKSPISGTIDKIEVEVGEAVNGLEDVIRIVKTDPLWIDVPVPLTQGQALKQGQSATIVFPNTKENSKGKIIYISTVADAASSTLRVRVEIPNKQKRPAGEHVKILFSKAVDPLTSKSAE